MSLSLEQAKAFTDEAIAAFESSENKQILIDAIATTKDNPEQKMTVVLPIIQQIAGPVLTKYGFVPTAVMQAVMAVQMHAMKDPELQAKCTILQQKLTGQM